MPTFAGGRVIPLRKTTVPSGNPTRRMIVDGTTSASLGRYPATQERDMTNKRPWFLFGLMVVIAADLAGCGQQDGTPASHVGPASNGGTGRLPTDDGVTPGATGGSGATSGEGGAAGAAGTPGSGSAQSGVSATWSFPALIKDANGSTFPTYLAHLLGRRIAHPFPTDFACVTVSNTGRDPATIHLEVDFALYATAKSQDVTIGARSSKQTCLTPTFNIDALYHLTAPVTGMIEGHATDQADGNVGSVNQVVSVPPVSDIVYAANQGITAQDMMALSAVYVEPNAPVIDQLQRLAQPKSVFSNFGNGDPYYRDPYQRKVTLDPSTYTSEPIYVEGGENVAWALSEVTCASCASPSADVYIMTIDQFTGWTNGTSNVATAVWSKLVTGAQGMQSLVQGWYYFVVKNTDGAAGRQVTWARSVTREDVVRDLLMSLFSALRALGVTYTSVTNTFFSGWQHVRRVNDSLQALSANCIDGSLVFASAAELLGVEPVLILRTGHAYVGIRSAPGSPLIWTIETTMVGNPSTTPWDAYLTAMTNRSKEIMTDPAYEEVDVATMRQAGITPLVQQ
jgi:hypothetical protein